MAMIWPFAFLTLRSFRRKYLQAECPRSRALLAHGPSTLLLICLAPGIATNGPCARCSYCTKRRCELQLTQQSNIEWEKKRESSTHQNFDLALTSLVAHSFMRYSGGSGSASVGE